MPNDLPKKTIRSGIVDGIYVSVFTADPPSDEEWDVGVAEITNNLSQLRGSFTVTMGGGPNARQRKRIREALGDKASLSSVVVSSSLFVRTATTALNLFLQNPIKVFAPNEMAAAFQYLEIPPAQEKAIRQMLERFQKELGIKEL